MELSLFFLCLIFTLGLIKSFHEAYWARIAYLILECLSFTYLLAKPKYVSQADFSGLTTQQKWSIIQLSLSYLCRMCSFSSETWFRRLQLWSQSFCWRVSTNACPAPMWQLRITEICSIGWGGSRHDWWKNIHLLILNSCDLVSSCSWVEQSSYKWYDACLPLL